MPLLVLFIDEDDNKYVMVTETDCIEDVNVEEEYAILTFAEIETPVSLSDFCRFPLECMLREEPES